MKEEAVTEGVAEDATIERDEVKEEAVAESVAEEAVALRQW